MTQGLWLSMAVSLWMVASGGADELRPAQERPDTCGAAGHQGLVGTPIAAVTMPADRNLRVVRPGESVTMDFVPERLTVEIDEDGVIVRVHCG